MHEVCFFLAKVVYIRCSLLLEEVNLTFIHGRSLAVFCWHPVAIFVASQQFAPRPVAFVEDGGFPNVLGPG